MTDFKGAKIKKLSMVNPEAESFLIFDDFITSLGEIFPDYADFAKSQRFVSVWLFAKTGTAK